MEADFINGGCVLAEEFARRGVLCYTRRQLLLAGETAGHGFASPLNCFLVQYSVSFFFFHRLHLFFSFLFLYSKVVASSIYKHLFFVASLFLGFHPAIAGYALHLDVCLCFLLALYMSFSY